MSAMSGGPGTFPAPQAASPSQNMKTSAPDGPSSN